MGEKIREDRTAKCMRESTNLGMSVCPSPTRTLFIGLRGRHPIGRKQLNWEPMWKMLMIKVDLEKPLRWIHEIPLEQRKNCQTLEEEMNK